MLRLSEYGPFFKTALFILMTVLIIVPSVHGLDEKCGTIEEELEKCEASKFFTVTKEFFSQNVTKLCSEFHIVTICMNKYINKCMTLSQSREFKVIMEGPKSMMDEVCMGGELEMKFTNHSKCIRTINGAHCYQGFNNSTSLSRRENSTSAAEVCCSLDRFLECIQEVTYDVCGTEAANFLRESNRRLLSHTAKRCERLNYNNECSFSPKSQQITSLFLFVLLCSISLFSNFS